MASKSFLYVYSCLGLVGSHFNLVADISGIDPKIVSELYKISDMANKVQTAWPTQNLKHQEITAINKIIERFSTAHFGSQLSAFWLIIITIVDDLAKKISDPGRKIALSEISKRIQEIYKKIDPPGEAEEAVRAVEVWKQMFSERFDG